MLLFDNVAVTLNEVEFVTVANNEISVTVADTEADVDNDWVTNFAVSVTEALELSVLLLELETVVD